METTTADMVFNWDGGPCTLGAIIDRPELTIREIRRIRRLAVGKVFSFDFGAGVSQIVRIS